MAARTGPSRNEIDPHQLGCSYTPCRPACAHSFVRRNREHTVRRYSWGLRRLLLQNSSKSLMRCCRPVKRILRCSSLADRQHTGIPLPRRQVSSWRSAMGVIDGNEAHFSVEAGLSIEMPPADTDRICVMTMLSLLALYSPKLISWLLKCVLVANSIDGRQVTIHDAVVHDSSTLSPCYSKLRQKKSVVGR